jgi:hypothetical protein
MQTTHSTLPPAVAWLLVLNPARGARADGTLVDGTLVDGTLVDGTLADGTMLDMSGISGAWTGGGLMLYDLAGGSAGAGGGSGAANMDPNTLRGRIVEDAALDEAVICEPAVVCARRSGGFCGATTRSVSYRFKEGCWLLGAKFSGEARRLGPLDAARARAKSISLDLTYEDREPADDLPEGVWISSIDSALLSSARFRGLWCTILVDVFWFGFAFPLNRSFSDFFLSTTFFVFASESESDDSVSSWSLLSPDRTSSISRSSALSSSSSSSSSVSDSLDDTDDSLLDEALEWAGDL